MNFHRIQAALAAAGLCLLAAPVLAGEIRVTVEGVASNDGRVLAALFGKASEFPSGKRLQQAAVPAARGRVALVFKDVPAGRYALSIFHDVNGNGRLDANMVGMPTEPYGASRDASSKLGPPRFDDAAVTVGVEPLSLTIHLH
jgi:uncharacterized protein (DUF2141 family)